MQYPKPDEKAYDDEMLFNKEPGYNARTQAERRRVLSKAINSIWSGYDIAFVLRFEHTSRHYYGMWNRPTSLAQSDNIKDELAKAEGLGDVVDRLI